MSARTSTPALDWPAFAMRCAHRIGSSLIEPLFSRNVHSPKKSSEPHTLIAGTRNRRSTSSRIATAFSLMCGPMTAMHPSSTSSPNASISRLDRALRQSLRCLVDEFDGTVDHFRRVTVAEHELHRFRERAPIVGAAELM